MESLLGGVGIIGLALGFAFQNLAATLMSGFMIVACDDNDITMPLPIRTLDFTEMGGNLPEPSRELLRRDGS